MSDVQRVQDGEDVISDQQLAAKAARGMSMSEICFKIAPGTDEDGRVIAIMPDGWTILRDEILAWIKDGKEPAALAQMPKYTADRLRREMAKVCWQATHSPAEIEAEYGLPKGAGEREMQAAIRDIDPKVIVDVDTNYGKQDLKTHGVVRVPELTAHEQGEFLDSEWDMTKPYNARPVAKRRYKVAYETALSALKVADLRDPTKTVLVDRVSVPLAKTVIVSTSKTVAVEKVVG